MLYILSHRADNQAMSTATAIIKEHRIAASQQRKALRNRKKARAFLVRAGILAKNGKELATRYR